MMRPTVCFSACCTMLLCLTGAAQAQDLGRLFSTPAQRAQLEQARHAKKASAGAPGQAAPAAAAPSEAPPVEGEQILVVNGVVRRSGSGRETTWIDSVPHAGAARLQGGAALVRGGGADKVALTLRSGQRVNVKPGQTVDAATGRVKEAYQPAALPKPRIQAAPAE